MDTYRWCMFTVYMDTGLSLSPLSEELCLGDSTDTGVYQPAKDTGYITAAMIAGLTIEPYCKTSS